MAVICCNPSPHLSWLTIRWQQIYVVSHKTMISHRKEKLIIKGDKKHITLKILKKGLDPGLFFPIKTSFQENSLREKHTA